MRGVGQTTGELFSYVDLEARVRADHPLRPIRAVVNEALSAALSRERLTGLAGGWYGRGMQAISYARALSYRDVEELLAERGIEPAQDAAWPHALRVHLQNLDRPAKQVQVQPDTPHPGTKQLATWGVSSPFKAWLALWLVQIAAALCALGRGIACGVRSLRPQHPIRDSLDGSSECPYMKHNASVRRCLFKASPRAAAADSDEARAVALVRGGVGPLRPWGRGRVTGACRVPFHHPRPSSRRGDDRPVRPRASPYRPGCRRSRATKGAPRAGALRPGPGPHAGTG